MNAANVDPITLEIIRNRLEFMANAMQRTLLRSAVSVILKEGEDGSCGIMWPNGDTVAQAAGCPIHLTVMPDAVRAVTAWFALGDMCEGDAYILNDPYNGGTHLPDILMVMPVFHDGHVVAFSVALAHQEDIGGIEPGSMSANGNELFQEGLVIPPSPWLHRGQPVATTRNFIRYNVRLPDTVMGDMEAQRSACALGARSYLEMIDAFGFETVQGAIKLLFRQAEERVSARIETIPDGTYEFVDYAESHLPAGERIPVHCAVTVAGRSIMVDFAGTGAQQTGPINVNLSGATASVHALLRGLTDPHAPLNEGAVRPIAVQAPPGCLFNPQRPAPIALRAQVSQRAGDAVLGALTRAMPERMVAASHGGNHVISFGGVDAAGRRYGSTDLTAGGLGAGPNADGIDHLEYGFSNCRTPPAESWEANYPIEIVQDTPIVDSGGAGAHRGGLGVRREFKVLKGPVYSCHRAERFNSSPWGVLGGLPGRRARASIRRADGRIEAVHAKQVLALQSGDSVVIETAGGGGFGDPLTRAPERVLDDVLDRKISIDGAREQYGVVIDAATESLDEQATAALRAQQRCARGRIDWVIDRGSDGRVGAAMHPRNAR